MLVYHIVFAFNFINQYLAAIVTFVRVELLICHHCSSCFIADRESLLLKPMCETELPSGINDVA